MLHLVNFCQLTVHLGEPSFFGATTISEHQVVGVPTGTAFIMSSVTSLSMSCFTLFQWWGTGISVWTAVSIEPGMKVMSNGLPAIARNNVGMY